MHIFHPRRNDFFVVGMVQPDVGIWRLVDYQARLVDGFVAAREQYPALAKPFEQAKSEPSPRMSPYKYVPSQRHRLEVEHSTYERMLKSSSAALPK